MFIAMAKVGEGRCGRTIILCKVEGSNEQTALTNLKEMLKEIAGIETERYLGNWLKWKHTTFSVQSIHEDSEFQLNYIVQAIHALETQEEGSLRNFASIIGKG